MTRDQELAWAAGLFEGEGCFTYGTRSKEPLEIDGEIYYKADPKMKVSMTDKDVLERFAAIIETGNVLGPYRHSNPNAKPLYEWAVSGKKAITAINLIRHLLMSRRQEQIDKVLNAYSKYQQFVNTRKKLHRYGIKMGEPLRTPYKPKKLSEQDVLDIINRAQGDEYLYNIAKDYGITPQYVGQLVNGKNRVTERFRS